VSWGFCYIAEQRDLAAAVRQIVGRFAAAGIFVRNPDTKRITRLTEEGDQQEVTETELFDVAAQQAQLTFQLWFSGAADVVCSLRSLKSGLVCHTYSIQGFSATERDKIVRCCIEYFKFGAGERTAVWLVVDPSGETGDIDWDQVVLNERIFPPRLPSVLGLPWSRLSKLSIPAGWSAVRLGHVALISERAAFPPTPGV